MVMKGYSNISIASWCIVLIIAEVGLISAVNVFTKGVVGFRFVVDLSLFVNEPEIQIKISTPISNFVRVIKTRCFMKWCVG